MVALMVWFRMVERVDTVMAHDGPKSPFARQKIAYNGLIIAGIFVHGW